MITNKPFYFMRHGETDWNKNQILMGHSDIPLNELGKKQAKDAKNIIDKLNIASIYASPLLRAKETAEIVSGGSSIKYNDGLKELYIGVLEGEPIGDRKTPDYDNVEGAEKSEDFVVRIISAINEALKSPQPVLIVSHGGVFKKLSEILNLPYKTGLSNCDVVAITPYDEYSDIWSARVLHEHDEL